jgi:hypothetical protein
VDATEIVGREPHGNARSCGHHQEGHRFSALPNQRRDFGHLDVGVTVNDPKYYTRAFTVKLPLHLIPNSDVLEAVSAENEKDRVHLAN